MRGPRCHIRHTTEAVERLFRALVVMRDEIRALNHLHESADMRAAMAEAELGVRNLQSHIAYCEECEAP